MSIRIVKNKKSVKIKIKNWDKFSNWLKGFTIGFMAGIVLMIVAIGFAIEKPDFGWQDFIFPFMLLFLSTIFGALFGACYDPKAENPYRWIMTQWHFYLALLVLLFFSLFAGKNFEEINSLAFTLFLVLMFIYLIIRGILHDLKWRKKMTKRRVKELR